MWNGIVKLFHLYPGEAKKALLFCLLAFLWGTGGYGSLILSEGMFLQYIGAEGLPLTYLYIALSLFLVSSLLIFALNHININRIFLSIIIVLALKQLIFYFLTVHFSTYRLVWMGYKIFGWVILICSYIGFWAFVDQYFDLQAGKRFFAIFNSILFLADACGGGLVAYSLRFFQPTGLILIFSSLILLSIPFIFYIVKHIPLSADEHQDGLCKPVSIPFKTLIKKVFSSRYTLMLILFYFVMQLLAITTEFTYMDQFEKTIKTTSDHNHLTEFLGRCGMWIALGNMIFGMFFYNRLVRKIGVNNIVVIAPLFFLFIFLFWFNSQALFLAIFAIIAREGMVYSLDDNNLNLLLAGVPSKVKNQVRFGIESFFEPAGMLLSSSFLIFYQSHSKLLGIGLAIVGTIIVFLLRGLYPKAIFNNLISSHLNFGKKASDWFAQISQKESKKIEFTLLYSLRKGEESQQLLAFEYLIKLNNRKLLSHLLNHIGSLTLPAKFKAIDLLGQSQWVKDPLVIDRLRWWAKRTAHSSFQCHLHFYFARHGLLTLESVAQDLNSPHLGIRSAAILTLKKLQQTESVEDSLLIEQAESQLQLLLASEQPQELLMGVKILGCSHNSIDILMPFLKHPHLMIERQAAESIALSVYERSAPHSAQLIEHLKKSIDFETRADLLKALKMSVELENVEPLILAASHLRMEERKKIEDVVISLGASSSPILVSLMKNLSLPHLPRLLAAKMLVKNDAQLFKKTLTQVLPSDIDKSYLYFYHAHTIQKQLPEHNLSILEDALTSSFESTFNFVIQLLSLTSEINESEILANSLKSKNQKQRACAYETLEKSADTRLFAMIRPLLAEHSSLKAKLNSYLKRGGVPLNLTQLLDMMTQSANHSDQIIALTLKARLKSPNWRESLQEYLDRKQESYSKFAHELLEV